MKTLPANSILALTAAATALPAYAEEATRLGYRYSHYGEERLPAAQVAGGEPARRYRVETQQWLTETSLNPDWRLETQLMVETMSGASPWFVVPDADGRPVQVLSGATIQDERYALYGQAWRQRRDGDRLGLSAGISKERDYLALSGGVEAHWEHDRRRGSLSAGAGLSVDRLSPSEGGSSRFPERRVSADKHSLDVFAGYSRVLSPQSVARFSLSLRRAEGFLSDPYKLVLVEGNTRPDRRPGQRLAGALNLRLRHYLRRLGAALQLDWRHFRDDWGIVSDTLRLGALRAFGERWRLGLDLRWYQQGQARFHRPFFERARADGRHSSDYRLSPYGAISGRLSLDHQRGAWGLTAAFEAYDSDGDYAPRRVAVENPGLVDFSVYSLAVSYQFGGGLARPLRPPVEVTPAATGF